MRVVNAGAISPLVSLLHAGFLRAKQEAARALTCLALGDVAPARHRHGLVAQVGTGTAEAQEHVSQMLIQLAVHGRQAAIVDAGAAEARPPAPWRRADVGVRAGAGRDRLAAPV